MARKKAEPKKETKVAEKAEPKKVAKKAEPKVPQIGDPHPANKTIPELIEELHGRFVALHGESFRARQCSRITNKLKRLVSADDALKG